MNSITAWSASTLLAWALCANPAAAHTSAPHAAKAAPMQKEQKAWGIAGDAKAVTRTVTVRMVDYMRFTPTGLEFRQGETVRFVIDNDDLELHEFVLGNKAELDAHAAMMMKFPNMEHDEPWMVHVPAGGRGEIIWTFNRAGNFDFACLIARHYQSGMVGKVSVKAKNRS